MSLLIYIIILILQLSVSLSVCDREVNGSNSNRAKKFSFLGIVGLGRYNRQPTDNPATALAAD